MIVWLVPSFTASVISVFIIGVLLGPMFPIAINHVARVLPRHLVNGAVGWIAACGAGGSAVLPFLTGTIASNLGIESLQPLCVFKLTPIPTKSSSRLNPKLLSFFKTFGDDGYFGSCLGLCT